MKNRSKFSKIARKLVRILGWTVLAVVGLLLLIALAIQIPFVQNSIVSRVVTYASDKIGTPVSLEHISISFPKSVVLEGLYVEDQQQDTLLYAGTLYVDVDMLGLLSGSVELNEVRLSNVTANVGRAVDGVFNFDYIVDSFSGDEVPQQPAEPGTEFAIYEVGLEDIRFRFDDRFGGNDISLILKKLSIEADEFDLSNQVLDFGDVTLEGAEANIKQYLPSSTVVDSLTDAGETDSTGFLIAVQDLDFGKVFVRYMDDINGSEINLDLGALSATGQTIDLKKQVFAGESVNLSQTFFAYHQMQADSVNESPPTPDTVAYPSDRKPGWRISLDHLTSADNSFQYRDFTKTTVKGLDPGRLWVTDFQTDIEGIVFAQDEYKFRIGELSFKESSGFRLNSFTAGVLIDSTETIVDNFDLQSEDSRLRLSLKASYPSLAELTRDLEQATVDAAIETSHIGLADVALLTPALLPSLPLHFPDSGRIDIGGRVRGSMQDIAVESLHVSMLGGTLLDAGGHIRNVSRPDDLAFDVNLGEFRTTSHDIVTLLPDTLLPQSLTLPAWLRITGDFSGTLMQPEIRAVLDSDLGAVRVDAALNLDSTSEQGYAGSLQVDKFDLGTLLKQDGMGVLDLEGSLEGSGMTMDDIDVYAKVQVNEFEFNDYVYHNLSVDGSLEKNIFNGRASMNDPNLKFDLNGDLDYGYSGVKKEYHFDLDLEHADLQALNFLGRPLKMQLQLDVDLDDADPGNLNGGFAIHDATFNNGERVFKMDSLMVASINEEGKSSLNIDSDFIHGEFTGTFQLLSLPEVLREHFSNYYALDTDSASGTVDEQQFEFNLELRNTSFLTEVLMPDLNRIDPGEIKGSFNSAENRLDLSIVLNELDHTSIKASDIKLTVTSARRELEYEFSASNIAAGAITIPEVILDGRVAGDSIETGFVVYDSAREERYVLRGIFRSLEDAYKFSLLPDYVVLNYDSWNIPRDNAILVARNGFAAERLDLTFEEQSISVRAPVGQDSTLAITLKELDLKSLLNIAFADTLVTGRLDGDINVHGSETRGPLEATIDIRGLAVGTEPMGDMKISIDQASVGETTLEVAADGPGIAMRIDGVYDAGTEETPEIELQANISKLDLRAVQPFIMNQVSGLKGNVTGRLSVLGQPDKPDIDGALTFENVEVTPSYTGSALKLNNETITFRQSTVSLNNFTLRDRVNNSLVLDGKITAGDQYALDLTAKASNFQLLNTAEGDNELFYGQVWLNTTSKVQGTLDHPVVEMNVSLGEKSNFTFVVPQNEAGVMESEGIVKFVDRDKPNDSLTAEVDSLVSRAPFEDITLTSRIELGGNETFSIVLDPLTEDKLVVSGEATLTLDIDATGNMDLTGRYELTKGTYDFTFYNLVKKNFEIESGSSITFNGEPLNALLDITARHRVEASPADLIASQAGEGVDLEQYKARLPFLVFLKIKGDLLRPEISFALDMPASQRGAMGGGVYAMIQDINTRESDLNKQVFALLILQRFVADNPFETQSGGTLQATARTSVNRMLSDQLNRMAENIKGVELTFDLQSYEGYENGGSSDRTQLQLGVSKSLLDERLVVKLSGNVDLEGGEGQGNFSDYIGDLALEYKLTEDGRFRINGFYNSDYDMIDGELKETGVGLIYIKDYDSLRELFKPNDQREE